MAIVLSIVSYPFLPARVGGQKGVALFNKYFSRYHQLICVTTKRNDPTAAEGYRVLNVLSNSAWRYVNPAYFFLLRKLIRQYRATHILLEHPYYGWLGVLLKWFCGVKLIVHSHNIEGNRWKTLGKWWWPVLWQYERFTHRRADYNFFIHDIDRQYALEHFGLKPTRCVTMTYGIEWAQLPSREESLASRNLLHKQYGIPDSVPILLFNGAFNYLPNVRALEMIINHIVPRLDQQLDFVYRIIICGRDIPETFRQSAPPQVILAGFVEDIAVYFRGADCFINPVTEGGGIKTKLVEALGNNLNAVSTQNGALGVDPAICNGKLLISADYDWPAFVENIRQSVLLKADIPSAYFDHFYWGYSTRRAADFINRPV